MFVKLWMLKIDIGNLLYGKMGGGLVKLHISFPVRSVHVVKILRSLLKSLNGTVVQVIVGFENSVAKRNLIQIKMVLC